MKNLKYFFLSLITSFILLSCQNGFLSNEGYISFSLPEGPGSSISRAADSQVLQFNVSVLSDGEEVQSVQGKSLDKVKFTLLPGNYVVQVNAYSIEDSEFKKPLYEGSSEATVIAGQTTRVTIKLKKLNYETYSFVKNVFNDNGDYNYYLGLGIPEDSIEQFKEDAKVEFTATFVPDTDFEGKIDFHYAHNLDKEGNNNWSLVYGDTKTFSWKKGVPCTLVFDFIVPYDLDPALDYGFGLSYFPSDLDSGTTFESLDYKTNTNATFETVKITYHYGNQTVTHKRVKGMDYVLIKYDDIYGYKLFEPNYLWLQVFNGWVEKGDATNTPITMLTADQNTKDREFYLDYDLLFGKNEWDVGKATYDYHYRTEAPFSIWFPDVTKSPAAGDHVKFLFTANAGKDFAGKSFTLDAEIFANDTTGWDYINSTSNSITVDSNGKLETYFDILIPESRTNMPDLDHLILHLRYQKTTLDKESVFTDWSLKLVDSNPFISETATTEHMILKATDKGVHVTVQLLDTDKFIYQGNTEIVDLDTHTVFRIDTNYLNENKIIEIDYPLCKKDDEMHMALQYNLEYTDGSGTAWKEEATYVLAGGGIGQLDYTDFDKMVLSYDTDNYTLNLTNSSVINWYTFLGQKLNIANHSLDFSVISGNKNWTDGTFWASGNNLNLEDSNVKDSPLFKLFTEGKVYIFDETQFGYCFFDTGLTLNKKLSQKPTLFFGLRYQFNFEGYNEKLGSFYTKEIQTDVTAYAPKEFEESCKIELKNYENLQYDVYVDSYDSASNTLKLQVEGPIIPYRCYFWYINGERKLNYYYDSSCNFYLSNYEDGEYLINCIITEEDQTTILSEVIGLLKISNGYYSSFIVLE